MKKNTVELAGKTASNYQIQNAGTHSHIQEKCQSYRDTAEEKWELFPNNIHAHTASYLIHIYYLKQH